MNVDTVSPWAWAVSGMLARLHLHDLLERPDLLRVIAWKDIRERVAIDALGGTIDIERTTGDTLDDVSGPLHLLTVLDRLDTGDREARWVLMHARELDRLRYRCERDWRPTCRECAA